MMKAISIYALTRKQNISRLSKLERQLSGRERPLNIRAWEWGSMKALMDQLEKNMPEVYRLRLFYSFQIPRLGKEFDLLEVKEKQIINIELKSGVVSEEAIRRQLIQNRSYLSVLGRTIRSYTYISSQNRLVRLTKHDNIVEADWKQLCEEFKEESTDYEGDLEELFRTELYLISPLTQPDRFLKKEYFLTAQQNDIKRQILKKIRLQRSGCYWFTGLPGTGKTLLLYDIAMRLSGRHKVCMILCGDMGQEWKKLNERLLRIVWMPDSQITEDTDMGEFAAVLVDEAHVLNKETLQRIVRLSKDRPIIFSGDCEDQISPEEAGESIKREMEKLPKLQVFRLTNRIRTNAEISSFIQNMMRLPGRKCSRRFPHVTIVYANDDREAENLLRDAKEQGYQVSGENEIAERTPDYLAVLLDESYYYDEYRYLRSKDHRVRSLFHQLNRAKEKLMLVVKNNEQLYGMLLNLQM